MKPTILKSTIIFLLFFFSESSIQAQSNGKVVFLELKTALQDKNSKTEPTHIIDYTVPNGKYFKIESCICSPIPGNSQICNLYLNDKLISHYSFIRPPLVVSSPLPIYLPEGIYKFKLVGELSNAFISGILY